MVPQEHLRDVTESYLKSVIAETAGTPGLDIDAHAAFGEMGIDSFHVLKIVKRLEADFGRLPKSLLFENFRVSDLAGYFMTSHAQTVSAKFGARGNAAPVAAPPKPVAPREEKIEERARPVRMLERDAFAHPELGPLVRELYDRYKFEGSASRGTRTIAPNLFIGSARRGYFNYGRSGNIILVYCYSGPQEYLPELREELFHYCEGAGLQLNFLNDEEVAPIAGRAFSATPFGAMQRITGLKEFSLDGGAMRRLRYMVQKFEKAGAARTVEYRAGSDAATDAAIAGVIERWCAARTMVNPLVHEVKEEIVTGTLDADHRLFLTYLDDVLQNVILISAMSEELNGFLMDLEFYGPEMPLGGLEFAIVKIIEALAAEGRDLLSLGGTYGCKLADSPTADPDLDAFLADLRERKIFNDESNLQFKNKFRPQTAPIFLCRPAACGDAENVIDIIMMIADPHKAQTPDAEAIVLDAPAVEVPAPQAALPEAPKAPLPPIEEPPAFVEPPPHHDYRPDHDRRDALAQHGFNPLALPHEAVAIDLKTDSWAQLQVPYVDEQMQALYADLQHPVGVDDTLRAIFPFTYFLLTESGQAAEHAFFKAFPAKGVVPQNLLFPSTIAHQLDQGFTPLELPHPSLFQPASAHVWKGNLDLDALQAKLARDAAWVSCVCIEVADNAAGGHPVSMEHLRDVKALLARHSIPLVLDATRAMENAAAIVEHDREYAGRGLWAVVREILSHADAVVASLTKDFCVNGGGIVATNDASLFQRLQEVVHEDGGELDLVGRKLLGLSLRNRTRIESSVRRRIENVRVLASALGEHGVPVVLPAGSHCVLIDVRRIAEFAPLPDPVASFLAWLYAETGIRATAHSAGMQKNGPLNDRVRLAVPVGLPREQARDAAQRIARAFAEKTNIPELVLESPARYGLDAAHAVYRLVRVHRPTRPATRSEAAKTAPGTQPVAPEIISPRPRRVQDVAIVGMAGRYPRAKNLRELWQNLAAGVDCIEELPAERWERRLQYGAAERYRGGFLTAVDRFDSLFFNISPREAQMLDPQERLFLEVAWEAIEDAGYYPEILAGDDARRNVGVFVGAVWSMYQVVGVDEQRSGNPVAPNSFLWSIANRVSYWMNLSGPSLTVDTACSSSLTALHLAYEAIQSGECSSAIVGGVNLDLHQAKFDINRVGGALSPDGVCRTFGKGANGYVAGEGIGALLLKPLDEALADRDHVYGVIKATAINHGGRTSGFFVPNPAAQRSVIEAALERANVDASTIGYVEAHGTGTELGDPIEIAGLTQAFSGAGGQSCAIGSVKTNIGHLEAAAGVVSVSKVLLQMQNRQLVPSLHSAELNPFIDFEHSPFYVPQRTEEWVAKEEEGRHLPLRAGISSFGAGGANAHVILESCEPGPPLLAEAVPPVDRVFPLSARNEEQLREVALRLVAFLREKRVDLADVAFTLQQGRKSFEQRVALVASTQNELIEKLELFVAGKKHDDVIAGHVKLADSLTRLLRRDEKQELVRLLSQSRDTHRTARLWAEGLFADWQGFEAEDGRRMPLPTYPFADRRHWIAAPAAARRSVQATAAMHPMVDANESTFERQLFRKTFTERDFFIHDHLVSGIPTLPGVAYLELARKAGELAAGRPVRRIQNILWVSPIAVQNGVAKEVFVELKPSGEAVQFEVFSLTGEQKVLHSQGKLLYTSRSGEPESIDLDAIRARCTRTVDGRGAYPLFDSFGLGLGPSFQVLQSVHKNDDNEVLGVLELPEFRRDDLGSLLLHPSLIDGSLQAGMAARLSEAVGDMLVPFSIGEVELVHPLQAKCFSYTTEAKDERKESRVLRSNVLIVDESGKVLARIRESTGVPLTDVHEKSAATADAEGFARLFYAYDWERAPLPVAEHKPEHEPRTVLLFDAEGTLSDLWRATAGAPRIVTVRPGAAFACDDDAYTIDPRSKDDYARLFASLAERAVEFADLCFAWTARHADVDRADALAETLDRGVASFLLLCQALAEAKLEGKVQLVFLHATREGEAQPQNEAMYGFVNTLRAEMPKLLCKVVEVRTDTPSYGELLDALGAELRARSADANAVRWIAGERLARRLKATSVEETAAAPLRDDAVCIITGGVGGLGLLFAEWLAAEHKARLVLTGRSALTPAIEAKLDALRARGAEVLYVAADVARREDVESVVRAAKERFGAVHGVIHAAGIVRDAYLRNKSVEDLRAVIAPKIAGTLHLDAATDGEPLDFFVLFSSLAAVTGNPGQADYGYANAFMDSFAAERERRRLAGQRAGRTLSVNWSLWADGGMRPDEQTELALKKTLGMRPLGRDFGIDAFRRGLASSRTQLAVLEAIPEKLEAAWAPRRKAPAPAPAATSATTATAAQADDAALLAWLQDELSQIVVKLLQLDAADVASDKILLDLGFDSIGLTSYANSVNERFDLDITPVLFFDYPSIAEIARNLVSERREQMLRFFGGNAAAPQVAPESESRPAIEVRKSWTPPAERTREEATVAVGFSAEQRFVHQPIAIVGMSGAMPQSADLEEFWRNLADSKDLVTVVPPERWSWEEYFGDPLREANKTNSKWGGFMKEVDKFDPLFFGISPREAQMMDPQQRLFLEHVWKAVEDSGHKVSELAGSRTGVFVGVATNDYLEVLTSGGGVLDGYSASGNSHAVLANRVSFLLGLRGPSAPLDTACSSSLVAMHRAIESIHTGSCDMAIAGGVHVMLSPAAYISFSMAGMLSPDGKCKTFDKRANGYVRGEGVGALFLKSLAAAEADGDHIYAVIRATAENHGGRVTALTAPNSVAQAELLVDAYTKAQFDPATVGYIECHGTGTSLGDPIEIQALTKAFAELYKRHGKEPAATPHCGLSSVKTNIGHLETAAGVAGVMKAALAIQHRQIPANLHLEEINPYIHLDGTPFFIAGTLTPWEAPRDAEGKPLPRRAGISSFGFGGANAHIVLEEYVPRQRAALPEAGAPQLIVLSAKNEQRLDAYVRALHDFVTANDVALIDLAWTLQAGRDEMTERIAIVAAGLDDLRRKLAAIVSGATADGVYRDRVRKDAPQTAEGDLAGIAAAWTAGTKIDWRRLYPSGLPRRIAAPTYPFARDRYWAETPETVPAAEGTAVLHPLVHRNVSTFEEQKFAARYSGNEFFFTDHVVETQKILPGVAYLEIARAAGELAANAPVRAVRNLVWERPLIVGGEAKEIEVALVPAGAEVRFTVRSDAGTHCTGRVAYDLAGAAPARLDLDAIRARCAEEVMTRDELYSFLRGIGLQLGRGFQIVDRICANESEALAELRWPEHLRAGAERFLLHPALMDGSLHTAIGLMKANGMDVPMSLPYSVGEVQILGPLRDLRYGYATWGSDDRRKITFHLLDGAGNVLVRLADFVTKALPGGTAATFTKPAAQEELKALLPVWNPVRIERAAGNDSAHLLLLGGDTAQLHWLRQSYANVKQLPIASHADVETIANALRDRAFDELLWIAPDVTGPLASDPIAAQQEGVFFLFRTVKALHALGLAQRKLQWTLVTARTQRVTTTETLQPAHAGVAGLIGSLAKELPQWDVRLLDVDSLASLSARDCLVLPFDKQGDALAYRRGQWFRQGVAVVSSMPESAPAYRENGVYVVIGGAGGVGEVWSRHMIERHRARIVWIGRQEYNATIEAKVSALAELGPAPLYIRADATDAAALDEARRTILELHPVIHGVVHSAIVLRDQTLARMDEETFRASLAAKVDVAVNMDRVFGADALDFMLFFSSIVSVVKSPGQSNYAAGCTFKDSFAHALQQRRPYPVKIMNWGYWGDVGVVADESYRKLMRQIGIGSIEPAEGMESLQVLVGSDLPQLAILKTLDRRPSVAGLDLSESIAYAPRVAPPTLRIPTVI